MKNSRLAVHCILSVSILISLNGCALMPRRWASETRDRDFVSYWPPAANDGRLKLAVKDLIDMKGIVTTAGSEHIAKTNPPAARDAKCLAIARQRNVQIVGRTNVTEFAVTVSGINDYFGTPRNHVARKGKLIPGGSSSGSAVAVATGRADVAFGPIRPGSIRVPAACCGVVGLKTTHGLIPLDGVFPIAPKDLDTVGPMARDVKGVVQGMDLLQQGFSGRLSRARGAHPSAKGIKVGRLYLSGTDPRVDKAVDQALEATGFKVVRLDPSFTKKWEQAEKGRQDGGAGWRLDSRSRIRHEAGSERQDQGGFDPGTDRVCDELQGCIEAEGEMAARYSRRIPRGGFYRIAYPAGTASQGSTLWWIAGV
jgi:Asp-tRNA(Asn)/Glu-tRNA(Gln) amidotransferase A subunit family amidase